MAGCWREITHPDVQDAPNDEGEGADLGHDPRSCHSYECGKFNEGRAGLYRVQMFVATLHRYERIYFVPTRHVWGFLYYFLLSGLAGNAASLELVPFSSSYLTKSQTIPS